MASKRDKARARLRSAQQLAAKLKQNLTTAPPELIAHWQQEWDVARAEVQRLQREITS